MPSRRILSNDDGIDLEHIAPVSEDLTKESRQLAIYIMPKPNKICLKVNPKMSYRWFNLEGSTVIGNGGYGSVQYAPKYHMAVKIFESDGHFRWELAMSLILSNAARRPELSDIAKHFLQIYAFSKIERAFVMEPLSHDLKTYAKRYKDNFTMETLNTLTSEFKGLAKALAFLNIDCGLVHMDVKSNNILVKCDANGKLSRLVLADFSLTGPNTNSILNQSMMVCPSRGVVEGLKIIDSTTVKNHIPSDSFIIYNGHCRAPEVIINYCNGKRYRDQPMDALETLGLDLFSLGQVVQEILFEGILCRSREFSFKPKPNTIHEKLSHDYMMRVLAYRIVLSDNLISRGCDLSFTGPLSGTVESVNASLFRELDRILFQSHVEMYERIDLREKLLNVIIPPETRGLCTLAGLLCHWDADLRRSAVTFF